MGNVSVNRRVPHSHVVVVFCLLAIIGYGICSWWVMQFGDPASKGDMTGTWKSFATLAFGFWLGSSSGGKARDVQDQPPPPPPPEREPKPADDVLLLDTPAPDQKQT